MANKAPLFEKKDKGKAKGKNLKKGKGKPSAAAADDEKKNLPPWLKGKGGK